MINQYFGSPDPI